MSTIACPKCGADMRTYERSGMTIEQCTDCRGVFLDNGELKRLIEMEGASHEQQGSHQPSSGGNPAQAAMGAIFGGGSKQQHRDHDYYDDHHSYGHKKHKRKSFLSEIFDD